MAAQGVEFIIYVFLPRQFVAEGCAPFTAGQVVYFARKPVNRDSPSFPTFINPARFRLTGIFYSFVLRRVFVIVGGLTVIMGGLTAIAVGLTVIVGAYYVIVDRYTDIAGGHAVIVVSHTGNSWQSFYLIDFKQVVCRYKLIAGS